jgi:hypothetical protein
MNQNTNSVHIIELNNNVININNLSNINLNIIDIQRPLPKKRKLEPTIYISNTYSPPLKRTKYN